MINHDQSCNRFVHQRYFQGLEVLEGLWHLLVLTAWQESTNAEVALGKQIAQCVVADSRYLPCEEPGCGHSLTNAALACFQCI